VFEVGVEGDLPCQPGGGVRVELGGDPDEVDGVVYGKEDGAAGRGGGRLLESVGCFNLGVSRNN